MEVDPTQASVPELLGKILERLERLEAWAEASGILNYERDFHGDLHSFGSEEPRDDSVECD